MKYTPEQITELLEEVNNAIQLGYYPKFEQIKQLTEIVQQQAKQLSEAWKAYDNLLAEVEALGAEVEKIRGIAICIRDSKDEGIKLLGEALKAMQWQSSELRNKESLLEETNRDAVEYRKLYRQAKAALAIAVEALGHIEHGVPGQDASDLATEALDQINIKASQETK